MFCNACGTQLPEASAFCSFCGRRQGVGESVGIDPARGVGSSTPEPKPLSSPVSLERHGSARQGGLDELCVAGAVIGVLSLLLPGLGITGIAAIVLSSTGISRASHQSKSGKGLAAIGIVLGMISIIYVLVLLSQI